MRHIVHNYNRLSSGKQIVLNVAVGDGEGAGGLSAEHKAPSGRSFHRWSPRPTEQRSVSAALLNRAPVGCAGAFGRHEHILVSN